MSAETPATAATTKKPSGCGKVILKLFLLIVVLVAAFAVYVAYLPSAYTIQREIVIDAPPEAVFPHVSIYKNWPEWSPWAELDPNCKYTYTGPEGGVGAGYTWDGNNDIGSGSMETKEEKANEFSSMSLDFTRPFASHCDTGFRFIPEDGKTRVVWTMSGEKNYLFKLFGVFMDMDKMIGDDFDKGLGKLKALVEKPKG